MKQGKKTRALPIVAIIIVALIGATALCACNSHEHTYDEWQIVTEATCLKEGVRTRKCTKCDKEQTESYLGDHKPVENKRDATCTEDGYSEGSSCFYCGTELSKPHTIPATDHDWDDWNYIGENKHTRSCKNDPAHVETKNCEFETTVVEPTCDAPGYTLHACKYCDNSYTDAPTEATDHDWGAWQKNADKTHTRICQNDPTHTETTACEFGSVVTDPTCEEDGYTTYTCDDCGNTYTDDPVPAKQHNYGPCTTCDNGTHTHTCLNCDQPETVECVYDEAVTGPTCDKDGYTTYTCRECDYTYTEKTADKLQHKYGPWQSDNNGGHYRLCENDDSHKETGTCEYKIETVEATCSAGGYTRHTCEECKHTYVTDETTKLEHVWGQWKPLDVVNHTHSRKCENCDETQEGNCPYTSEEVEPTCEEAGYTRHTCPDCHETHIHEGQAATGHQWGPWEEDPEEIHKHKHTCTVDSVTQYEDCDYVVKTIDPTCEAAGRIEKTCSICHDVEVEEGEPALDHDFADSDWTYLGKVDGEDYHHRFCRREECGFEEKAACVMVSVEDAPTCSNPDGVSEVCEKCLHTEDEDGGLLTHLWTQWTTKDGRHSRSCTRCPAHEDEPCNYSIETTDPTCTADGKITKTCSVCNDVIEEKGDDKLGHNYDRYVYNESTKTHDKTCSRCSTTENEPCRFEDTEVDPDCETDGYVLHVCSDCQGSYTTAGKPQTGHAYGDWHSDGKGNHSKTCTNNPAHVVVEPCSKFIVTVTEPECEKQGFTTHKCSDCDYSYDDDPKPALTHNWGKWTFVEGEDKHIHSCIRRGCSASETFDCTFDKEVKLPSCTEAGYTTYTCSVCEHSDVRDNKDMTEHSFGKWTPETEHGKHKHVCTVCSFDEVKDCEYTQTIVPPTCDDPGKLIHSCNLCNEVHEHIDGEPTGHKWGPYTYSDGRHSRVCLNDGTHVDEGECDMELTTTVPSTCRSVGYELYTCSECSGTQKIMLPNPGHKYGEWKFIKGTDGRYHHRKYCEVCGWETGGVCVFTDTTVNATCDTDGYTEHKCNTCGHVLRDNEVKAFGHVYDGYEHSVVDGVDYHTKTCTRDDCDHSKTEKCNMVEIGETATCLTPGDVDLVCSVCKYTSDLETSEALGHDWDKCEYFGISDGRYMHKKVCKRDPNHFEITECEFTSVKTDATCTVFGSTTYTCSLCRYEYTVVDSSKYGHDWEDVQCVDDNRHTATCKRCEVTETFDHDFEDSNICSICGYDGLTYTLSSDKRTYMVSGDNKVPNAEHIVIPAFHDDKPVNGVYYYAFYKHAAITDVVLPASILKLDMGAFCDCVNLTSVTFDGEEISLEEIATGAFEGCKSLSKFTLPSSVQKIGDRAFKGCAKLQNLTAPETAISLGAQVFDGSGLEKNSTYWDGDAFFFGKCLVRVKDTAQGGFAIKDGTLTVAGKAFENCTKIDKLTIPATVSLIQSDAFLGCQNLASVEYKGSTTQWFHIAFMNDYSSPMHYATSLHIANAENNVVIPDTVTAIPAGTFRNTNIESIEIPASITSIGANAFRGCSKLATIHLPDSVRTIGENAFLDSLYYDTPTNWTNDGALYIDNHLIAVKSETTFANGEYTVRAGTLTIAPYTFKDNKSLRRIVLPASLLRIGKGVFDGCTNLKKGKFTDTQYNWFAQGIIGRQVDPSTAVEESIGNDLKFLNVEWRRLG